LIEASHQAGMAEVATDVLHNVGNVLNSINVSTTLISDKMRNSKVANLGKVVDMIKEHDEDLGEFLTEDSQGKHIPVYLDEVSKLLTLENCDIVDKLEDLADNVEHVKEIVSMQQSYAKVAGFEITVSLTELLEDTIKINSVGLKRHGVELVREFEELGEISIDKQKVVQILVNLINNAKYALTNNGKDKKLLTIRAGKHGEDRLRIEVIDNGIGIAEDNLNRIFQRGFTTKEHGHGFGLHSGALAAKELGGSLTVDSDGPGTGATFTLDLPYKPAEVIQ